MRFKDFIEAAPIATARQPHMYYHKANTPTALAMHQQYPNSAAQSAYDVFWKGTGYNDELANWTHQIATHLMNFVVDGQTTLYHGNIIIAKEYIDTSNKEIIQKAGGKITSEYAIASLIKNGGISPLNVAVHKVDPHGLEAIEKSVEHNKDLVLKTGNIPLRDCEVILNYIQYLNGETSTNVFGMNIPEKSLLPHVSNKFILEIGHTIYIPDDFMSQSAPPDAINYMKSIGLLQPSSGSLNLPCYKLDMQKLRVMQMHRQGVGAWRDLSNDIFSRIGQSDYQNQFIVNSK